MSKKEHTCENCLYGQWKRNGWDITMADDECGGCCSWNDKWQPKTYCEKEQNNEQN